VQLKGKYIDDSGLRKEARVKEGELSVDDKDWDRFTWAQLKGKMRGWPQTADVGYVPEEKKTFDSKTTLKSSGIVADPSGKMKRFVFRWDITNFTPADTSSGHIRVPSQPSAAPASESVVYYSHAPSSPRGTSAGAAVARGASVTRSAGPTVDPKDVPIELRVFVDGSAVSMNISSKGSSLTAELSTHVSKWPFLTWGSVKRSLPPSWPQLKDGGFFIIGGDRRPFADGDALDDCGVKVDPAMTKVYDALFIKV